MGAGSIRMRLRGAWCTVYWGYTERCSCWWHVQDCQHPAYMEGGGFYGVVDDGGGKMRDTLRKPKLMNLLGTCPTISTLRVEYPDYRSESSEVKDCCVCQRSSHV